MSGFLDFAKRPILKLGVLLILFAIGGSVGLIASEAFGTDKLVASEACESDECDDGFFGGSCEDNTGHSTGCSMEHRRLWFDGCTTYVCEN